jgi:predicted RNA-binding protein with PIN domain
MRYLIDGHNLIGQLPNLSLAEEHDEAKLVILLRQFAAGRKARIVVVFDHGMPGGWSSLSGGPVEVVFAGSHTNADRILRERIRTDKQPGQLTLVTNDREVIAAAKARKITIARSTDFARQLTTAAEPPSRRHAPPAAERPLSDAEVDEWMQLFGKGSEPKTGGKKD